MAKIYFIDVDGVSMTVRNYCKILGLNYYTVLGYMERHKELNIEQVIEQSMINKYTRHTKDRRLYHIWYHMISRCYDPKDRNYPRYGGRGIKVQDSWHNYFRFEDDMYDSYIQHCEEFSIEETTIEREDYDGNYCIENCIWETRKNQARNRRSNKKLDIDTNLMAECEQRNLPYQTILARINKLGWSEEEALNTPVRKRSKK